MASVVEIVEARTRDELRQVGELMAEWCRWLEVEHGVDLTYQAVEAELAGLPGAYAPPLGRVWLARTASGAPAGCVALRPLDDGICELKRMYVRPAYRGAGLGRALAVRALDAAGQIGYRLMRLDTAQFLTAANRLYADLGFREIGPYYRVPPDMLKLTVFLERTVDRR